MSGLRVGHRVDRPATSAAEGAPSPSIRAIRAIDVHPNGPIPDAP
ncbi:MAG: hypothetical protein AVDCRST_MAG11-3460 [uncultured Gemmatimonadaceae bacterium]|uniref:Uncharacterized protein n=1 Tax=uncultured Gemmatimonadaceae bacterium TaxID=246130 RepID=A0A6J4M4I4_9BACT|nr:MAG: hypothetical protein AVDCRST_MAG11-3460 [uncultured Gemmatimonadaceae bacterium]